ncbi:protein FAR1-RELATED SEQUENCE 5-like [Apium graveolens]|uniref:protein FAR1-RELATED SEQUENCE 5-like n=1 Tax=Apium graveolens TaxID=4045 RepID=UPI003D79F172
MHGGEEQVGFHAQHLRNIVRDFRKDNLGVNDTQAGLDLLHRLEEESGGNFFIRTLIDEEGRLKCLLRVEGKAPLIIITDQDQAMAGAIQSQLPNTTYLLCSWHISNNPEKLSTYYAKEEFKGDFNNCIYHSLTEEIFEDRWKALILKYKLEDNTWLQDLYNLKHKWIDAYTRNIFSAGQKTTSRSEGMNAFFDAYVGSCTGLKEFVEGAQKALERQFMRQKEEDYNTRHKIRCLRMKTALEQHAASIYTKEMFKKFQDQLVEAAKYFVEKD